MRRGGLAQLEERTCAASCLQHKAEIVSYRLCKLPARQGPKSTALLRSLPSIHWYRDCAPASMKGWHLLRNHTGALSHPSALPLAHTMLPTWLHTWALRLLLQHQLVDSRACSDVMPLKAGVTDAQFRLHAR